MKHIFYVEMSCEGCKNAIEKIINKIPGQKNIDFDMIKNIVTINGDLKVDIVMEVLNKWGIASNKRVEYIKTD
jgi:copper chaperone CopZ